MLPSYRLVATFTVFILVGILVWMGTNKFVMIQTKLIEGAGAKFILFKEPAAGEENIIFLETKCGGLGIRESSILLNPRQACAVEAAARNNPNASVYVLHTCEFTRKNILNGPEYLRLLLEYPNVYLSDSDWQSRFDGTPLEDWFQQRELDQSSYHMIHISDVLRYLMIWKYGGTYLDLDMVLTRSLHGMSNYAGAESNTSVAVGVFNFAHEGIGYELATACLEELRTRFRGDLWGYNGPGVITRVLMRVCGVDEIRDMTPDRCRGFKVYPPPIFYPIPWQKWTMYFDEEKVDEIMPTFHDSWGIHVWNKFSIAKNITVGSRTPYSLVAQEHCPEVYSNCGDIF